MTLCVQSPIVAGTGVEVVHTSLAKHIPNYRCERIHPIRASIPLRLRYRHSRADIIHTIPDMGTSAFSSYAKNVVTFHGYSVDAPFIAQQSSALRKLYYRNVLRPRIIRACEKADAITAVSHYLAELVQEDLALNRHIEVIHNGIDAELFAPQKKSTIGRKIRALYVGKLNDRKGFDIIQKIAPNLARKVEFCAVGDGKKIDSPHITHIPRVTHSKMPNLYNSVDVVVLPSSREGFSLVIAEAMACGLAVISSRTAAIPELIDHERGGLLCPPGSADAFKHALEHLYDNRDLLQEFGSYNRKKVLEQFTCAQMVAAYQKLFARLEANQ